MNSKIINEIVQNRGFEANEFLNPAQSSFPKYEFPYLKVARDVIADAIHCGRHITIWGDFDADGQTSTALFMDTFRILGYPNVSYHIPSRFDSNHGLNNKEIENIANAWPQSLIITCDNGTNDISCVEFGNSLGLEFVITDHHEQTGPLTASLATVNPSIHPLDSPFRGLVGVGVSYIMCRSLLIHFGLSNATRSLLDLVAIGTIADVGPNTQLNRVLLHRGLPILWSGQRIGIYHMMKLNDIKTFVYSTEEISFKIGPMLNAAGRMASADLGVSLLLSSSDKEAKYYAHKLRILNQDRQIAMAIMENELEALLPQNTKEIDGLVIVGENLHPGLIGLTAGKLARRFFKPSIVVTSMESDENMLRGSCRTSEGVHILNVLETQKDLLEQYGGHAGAAGFTIKRENIEDFMVGFLSSIAQFKKFDSSPLFYDLEIPWDELDITLSPTGTLAQIESLAPFNEGNPMPLLMSRNVRISAFKAIGDLKNHAVVSLTNGIKVMEAYWWRFDPLLLENIGVDPQTGNIYNEFDGSEESGNVDIIYSISRSFFIKQSVRISIEGIRLSS